MTHVIRTHLLNEFYKEIEEWYGYGYQLFSFSTYQDTERKGIPLLFYVALMVKPELISGNRY